MALVATFVKDRERHPSSPGEEPVPIITPKYTILQHQNASVRVGLDNISHAVVSHNAITIHTQERRYVKYQSLKAFQAELNCTQFLRIHRSTLVNMDHVLEIRPNANGDGTLLLKNEETLRFSRAYKAVMLKYLQETKI
ncbi:MAG: LytTR family transcriptional regulator [Cyanothece sp. SIO1E1]|nr:LytTR family transcriptional regulator [Cyanothece sp. SIO1E1]